MQAQTQSPTAVGEYYLQGVMETASGFRLNQDGTFNFFFSYGAMDREGGGMWHQDGESIVFNSLPQAAPDYSLVLSKKIAGAGIAIQVNESNPLLKKLVHAVVKNGNTEEQASVDPDGIIFLSQEAADSITFLFEWCPEKKYVFTVPDRTHNYFEFKLEPSIMEVVFKDFRLTLNDGGMTGPHPLMETKSFEFKKAR